MVETERTEQWPELPPGARYAVEFVEVPDQLSAAVQRVLRKVAVVENLPAAQKLIAQLPDVVAVTRDGDILSDHFAAGGSSATPTLIEVQSAIDDAERRLTEASHACERLRFAQSQLDEQHRQGRATVEVTLAKLHESDAAMAALAEELGQLSSTARSGYDEAERLRQAIADAEEARDRDVAGLADLEHRLELAAETVDEMEPDHAERDRLAEQARLARSAEMDARLALRTLRSGHVRWLVEPMRCAGRLKANGRRACVRSLAASAWCGRHVPRLPYTPGERSWRIFSNAPLPRRPASAPRRRPCVPKLRPRSAQRAPPYAP